MTFFQPAVRAHQAKRLPALDGGHRRGPHGASSPGAGNSQPGMYYYGFDDFDDHDGHELLTTGVPVTTTIVTDIPGSNIGDTPTPTTIVGVSTSMVTIIIPGGSSSSDPSPTLPAVIRSSDTVPSSSLLPSSPIPTPPTTPETTSPVLQSPVSGSITASARGGVTSSVDSVLAGASKNPSGPRGGVIAAIVIVILLALAAVTFFVLRRRRIQRRFVRRATWTANLTPHPELDSSLEKGISDAPVEAASQPSKEGGNGHGNAVTPVRNIARKPPLPYSPVSSTAPPLTRNNSPDSGAPSVRSASVSMVASTPSQDVPALVRMTFVPQLPDELGITPGETLYIQMEFDDGWALCANAGGKQGMVPLECLEGDGGQFAGLSHLRTVRRASSLRSSVVKA